MPVTLGGLTTLIEPAVNWGINKKGVLHELQDGGLAVDLVSCRLIYELDYQYLTASEYDTLEGFIETLGNNSALWKVFVWRDRNHDGATQHTSIGRILNKVYIESAEVYQVFPEGASETLTGKGVRMTLREI
jgi:hypothetical protein